MHVVAAALVNDDDEVLLQQRSPDVHQGGLFELARRDLPYLGYDVSNFACGEAH